MGRTMLEQGKALEQVKSAGAGEKCGEEGAAGPSTVRECCECTFHSLSSWAAAGCWGRLEQSETTEIKLSLGTVG